MHSMAVGTSPTTTTTVPGSRLLKADDVGQMLGVKPSWVYAQARAKRIPHVRLGRYTRFNQASIAAWAAEREEGPTVVRWEAPMRSAA